MINKLVIDTLKNLNIPVSFQFYSGQEDTYITFFKYLEQGEFFNDDSEQGTGYYIQLDIWSKSDYTTLAENVLNAMNSAGFRRTTSADLYEKDTKIYHRVFRFFYLEEKI